LKKGNNSLAASIPTLPGGALKGGGKGLTPSSLSKSALAFNDYGLGDFILYPFNPKPLVSYMGYVYTHIDRPIRIR